MNTGVSNNHAAQAQARISISHKAWEMTTFLVIAGGILAGGGWYCLAHSDTDQLALLPNQMNAIVITAVIYTNLVAIAALGLGGLYSNDSTMLGLYSVLLWNHFVLSLLSGGFLLWAILQGDLALEDGRVNNCTIRASSAATQVLCEYNFRQLQNLVVGTTAAMLIIELVACITCSRFVSLACKDEGEIYNGPETSTVWVPQPLPDGYAVVETESDVEGEEYKTPETSEFSRFSWV